MSHSLGESLISSPAARDAAVDEVDGELAGLDRRAAALLLDAVAQGRAHPGQELGDAERLGDVVVGAGIERRDLAALVVAAGEHQDRGVAQRLELGQERHAVAVGQAQVEQDQLRPVVADGAQAPRRRRSASTVAQPWTSSVLLRKRWIAGSSSTTSTVAGL